MFFFFYGGSLVYANSYFTNGTPGVPGTTKDDFKAALESSAKDAQAGRILPSNFSFTCGRDDNGALLEFGASMASLKDFIERINE
jgi:hypothetical protein